MKKNIHVLETDQPSRLGYIVESKTYHLYDNNDLLNELADPKHIYITSPQKIEKGVNTWYLSKFLNKPRNSGGAEYGGEQDVIILTTDLFLIEHSIQAIEDDFLEWFCQNPTCEFVEVSELRFFDPNTNKSAHCKWLYDLPLEEPKLDNLEERFKRDMSMVVIPLDNENIPEEPKQVICRDKFDRVIQDGCYVDVQNDGVHKVYRKEDGQLYFKPYGEEERVSNYFSNDLILIPYSTKLITDLKKEIADKKQDVFYNKKQEESKQETLEEAAERILANNIDGLRDALQDDDLFFFYKGVIQCYGEAMVEWQAEPKQETVNTKDLVDSAISGYHNDSFLLGLEDAIEQIVDEYDCCKFQFEGQEEKLNTIKLAFSRAISLIEDRMIQHKSKIKTNQFVDAFNRL
jgi:hypothetical protein